MFSFNGVLYEAAPETHGCTGCAFNSSVKGCDTSNLFHKCGPSAIIWVKKEKETPVKTETETDYEIAERLYKEWQFSSHDYTFIQWLELKKDPEYAEYIRLKEKFGE